jgi:hypothetical protein
MHLFSQDFNRHSLHEALFSADFIAPATVHIVVQLKPLMRLHKRFPLNDEFIISSLHIFDFFFKSLLPERIP